MSSEFSGDAVPLRMAGFSDVVQALGVTAAEVWAILDVETLGSGFLPDGRPRILFERHVFSRLTGGRFDATAPQVSAPTAGGYGAGGAPQYDRLGQAAALDRPAALRSASGGLGQIMGFNAEVAGFADAETMIAAMTASEDAQLSGLGSFVLHHDLHLPLRARAWADFARGYNGPDYAKHSYDTRLDAAYRRYAAGPLPDLTVRAAQTYLVFLGYSPGRIDGIVGRFTLSALHEWQEDVGRPVADTIDSGVVDELAAAAAEKRQAASAGGA